MLHSIKLATLLYSIGVLLLVSCHLVTPSLFWRWPTYSTKRTVRLPKNFTLWTSKRALSNWPTEPVLPAWFYWVKHQVDLWEAGMVGVHRGGCLNFNVCTREWSLSSRLPLPPLCLLSYSVHSPCVSVSPRLWLGVSLSSHSFCEAPPRAMPRCELGVSLCQTQGKGWLWKANSDEHN